MKLKKKLTINIVKNIAIAFLLVLVGFLTFSQSKESQQSSVRAAQKVGRVIDGDTIVMSDNVHVRLIGIDSPEKGECFYKESRQFVKDFLEGESVILEKEISGIDDYGRLLRFIIIPSANSTKDNLLVNDYIVRQGYARAVASPPDNRYRDLLISAQEEALRKNRGLWQACSYQDELSGRREKDDQPPGPDYIIKGNISTRGYGKTYLFPGCDNYTTVKIDLKKGEQYFRTEGEAESAGFRKATNCP